MIDYTIEREIEIGAPIEVVWRTITEPQQIRTWFSQGMDCETRPGARGTLTFGAGGDDDPRVVALTVVAVDPPHRFSFRWAYPLDARATSENSMLVTFTLTGDGDQCTTLRVVETGLEQLGWPDGEKRIYVDQHRRGWQTHGDKLRALFPSEPERPA